MNDLNKMNEEILTMELVFQERKQEIYDCDVKVIIFECDNMVILLFLYKITAVRFV